jgi:lipid II:glycine glycyltransferase (peptidoglycan interpeptide bridge formation enzyme)
MSSDAQRWDADLAERTSPAPLLQSWAWGEVQAQAGWMVERVQKKSDGAMATVLIRKFGPAREAYVPRGPVPATPEAIDSLIDWSRKAGIARLVLEPEAPAEFAEVMTERRFSRVAPIQPQHTRVIKLLPPDELLATFRHGRRYNIRTGIKRGVVVEEGRDAAELARQSAAVEKREAIHLPDRRYYQLLLDILPWCRTYTAYAPEKHEPLATVLVARHGGRAYSLFAGRSGRRRELMGNDLAWWSAISAAAVAGCGDFDLWGVPPPNARPNHPWIGIGMFKSEFGGEEVPYCGAWELVLSGSRAALLGMERKTRAYIRGLKRNIP